MWVVARIPHFYFTHIPFRPTYLTSNLLLSVPIYVGGGGGLGLLTLAKYVGGMCPVLVQKICVKCIWTQTFNVEAILTVLLGDQTSKLCCTYNNSNCWFLVTVDIQISLLFMFTLI